MAVLLREIGKLLAVLDEAVWMENAKKEVNDIVSFWSDYQYSFQSILNNNMSIPADEYKSRRVKSVLTKNKFWPSGLEGLKSLYKENQLSVQDLQLLMDGYNEEAENIFMANDFNRFKTLSNLSAQEISEVMNINKNSVLSWVGHKRNMPKQAYKDAKRLFKNFR